MFAFSQKYYPYLDEYEQQYNDIWFFKTLSYLKLGGKLYIPDLDLWFNKKGEECEPYEGDQFVDHFKNDGWRK